MHIHVGLGLLIDHPSVQPSGILNLRWVNPLYETFLSPLMHIIVKNKTIFLIDRHSLTESHRCLYNVLQPTPGP